MDARNDLYRGAGSSEVEAKMPTGKLKYSQIDMVFIAGATGTIKPIFFETLKIMDALSGNDNVPAFFFVANIDVKSPDLAGGRQRNL